jgi:hypothetical protein
MATTVIETYGVIRADGTLELEDKLTGPPRRVKVRVESAEAESDEDLAVRLAALVARWKDERRHTSKIKTMRECPAYREILAMGERAVPFILGHLEKDGGFLFLAMEDITGASVVPEKGDSWIEQLNAAWIAWGLAKGYRWERAV